MQKEHLLQEKALDAKQALGVARLEGKVSLEITVTGQDAANRLQVLPPSISSHKDCHHSSSCTLKVGEKPWTDALLLESLYSNMSVRQSKSLLKAKA